MLFSPVQVGLSSPEKVVTPSADNWMGMVFIVEMFKVRMQGQYGDKTDKRLRVVARDMWREWGFRKGVMRGYWVRVGSSTTFSILNTH